MIAVLVGDDDQLRGGDGAFDLSCRLRIVGLVDAAAEEAMDLLIHPGVHHQVAVGEHHLERGARLHAWIGGRAFDREILGAAALREFQDVDAHRLASRREIRDFRDVELAVIGQRQRPRNGRGRHQQHIRPQPLRAERGSLGDAEPMLLIDDDKSQLVERDRLLHECVRSDDQVRGAAFDVRVQRMFLESRRTAGQQVHAEP